jgi:hypothetical protein
MSGGNLPRIDEFVYVKLCKALVQNWLGDERGCGRGGVEGLGIKREKPRFAAAFRWAVLGSNQ